MVVVLTGKILFGILGWILAIFTAGFLAGAVVTYRRAIVYLNEAKEVLDVNETTHGMIASMKQEAEADRSEQ